MLNLDELIQGEHRKTKLLIQKRGEGSKSNAGHKQTLSLQNEAGREQKINTNHRV